MQFLIDEQSGTRDSPKRPELTSRKHVVAITALCDGDLERIKSLAQQAVAKARVSLQTSETSPSLIKYAYVFHKTENEQKQFVQYEIRVGAKIDDEIVYEQQGTDAFEPYCRRVEFGSNENVIVVVVFCDGENRLTSSDAASAQFQAAGLFERADVSVLTSRDVYVVEPKNDDSFVEFSVHQGVADE